MLFKILLLSSAVLIFIDKTEATTDKIICFLSTWAGYRSGDGSYNLQHINSNLCTHVIFAFLGVNLDGTLRILILDPWDDVDAGGFQNALSLKLANPNLKVLMSIGDWNEGNPILTKVIDSSVLRASLIRSFIKFLEKSGYDGIDIHWEYPSNRDKTNFVKLLQEMKSAFDVSGYIISITVFNFPLSSYDVPEITKVVDLINVMTYDYPTIAEGVTGHNAPLYGDVSVNTSVQNWVHLGADVHKLTLSIPFYGRSYSLQNQTYHVVGSPGTVGIGGPFTSNPGTLGYNEICAYYNEWTRVWDEEAQVPYRYNDRNWLSYDDPTSIGLKVKYAKDNGLAGVAIWSIDTDDFHGNCGTANILLRSVKNHIT